MADGGGDRGVREPSWVAELAAAQVEVELVELARRAQHAVRLRRVRELHAVLTVVDESWAAPAELALLTGCSERSCGGLLSQALLLPMLPGAMPALECGLCSVEQAEVVSRVLGDVSPSVCLAVWHRLRERLVVGHDRGEVLPPGRLRGLLTRWVLEADPQAAVEWEREGRDEADVGVQRRPDGLIDLYLSGLTGPNAQAILARVRARAVPWGAGDDRPAGRRRLDAAVDLLLGRDAEPVPGDEPGLPFDEPRAAGASSGVGQERDVDSSQPRAGAKVADGHVADDADGYGVAAAGGSACPAQRCRRPLAVGSGGPCGCRLAEPVPCGLDVRLLVPLGAAMGTTTELAHLCGYGPLTPVELRKVLLNAPLIRPVWVEEDGTPVAASPTPHRPARGDVTGLRAVLERLGAEQPPAPVPRHPDDHGGADAVEFETTTTVSQPTAEGIGERRDLWPAAARAVGREPPTSQGHPSVPTNYGVEPPQPSERPEPTPQPGPSERPEPTPQPGPSVRLGPSDRPGPSGRFGLSRPTGPPEPSQPPAPSRLARRHETRVPEAEREVCAGNNGGRDASEHPGRGLSPLGTPGPYRPPVALRRLVSLRAVLCEWPGCGRAALPVGARDVAADLDHDRPWPAGPTCGCNIGPLCRWHHRVKHTRWRKQRQPGNTVSWTDVTGRQWLNGSQHQAPQPPLSHGAGVRTLTLAEQCERSGLLTSLPGWLQQRVRVRAGDDRDEQTRRLLLHGLELVDPTLDLSPDEIDDQLSRDEHGLPPDDPGADGQALPDGPACSPYRTGSDSAEPDDPGVDESTSTPPDDRADAPLPAADW